MTRICLNMIVKNESARIERCLASVAPYISCYSITDTGSTDGTPDLIKKFLEDRAVPGWVNFASFVNFSQARNESLDYALGRKRGVETFFFDYLLLVDADMELVVNQPNYFDALSAPAYNMLQRSNTLSYWNTRLLRRDVDARYVGVTHEYLNVPGPPPERLYGPWFQDHQDGANRPGKLERDAALLEDDIREKARSFYYLGQTFRDIGKPKEAAQAYKARTSLGGWNEETWSAMLNAARCEPMLSDRVSGLIDAFNERPSRSEPLLDLAAHYRERGMNAAAMIFAEAGLKIPKPNDILFVEDYAYDWGFKEEISIAGYYTGAKARAHDFCEELALSRDAPAATRELAWRNLFPYTRPLAEQAPSLRTHRIDFTPPDGYHPCNPSVCRVEDKMYLNVRAVDYLIGDDGRYAMPPDGNFVARTRNFMFTVGLDLSTHLLHEITDPSARVDFDQCLGFEDVRLFTQGTNLKFSATTRQLNPDGWCEIVTGFINQDTIIGGLVIHPEGPQRQEKNWMPIIGDDPRWIYSCDPVHVINYRGKTVLKRPSPIASAEWGGSSQAIPFSIREWDESVENAYGSSLFGPEEGYLCLIHERQAYPDPMRGQRNYQRRFVWFDADFNIRRISRRFFFGDGEGEFVCGMCWHPDGKRLVISYGVLDREAWLATVDADEVRAMLREVGDGDGDRDRLGVRDPSGTGDRDRDEGLEKAPADQLATLQAMPLPLTEAAVAKWMEKGGLLSGHEHEIIVDPWLNLNTNAVLRNEPTLHYAIEAVKHNGWPVHPDRTKNWDCYIALRHVLKHTSLPDFILDAGADRVSTFLPTLNLLGYRHLAGLNLVGEPDCLGHISYGIGNIEATPFLDDQFAFIACLSTIEHGVNIAKFLREAARILKPGGHLFISTDYWPKKVDTRIDGWRILDKSDIWWLITCASAEHGLQLTSQARFDTDERVCHHGGCDYTFINLLFRKT